MELNNASLFFLYIEMGEDQEIRDCSKTNDAS